MLILVYLIDSTKSTDIHSSSEKIRYSTRTIYAFFVQILQFRKSGKHQKNSGL